MRSIFEYDQHVRRLIIGLAGRNIRRSLEIFLEFCTSGHIGEDEFLKIKQSQGQHVLPLGLVTTILLRLSQRYYDSSHSYLKNLFANDEHDERPSYFARLLILRVLQREKDNPGPKRLRGYIQVETIRSLLIQHGITEDVFMREIERLAQGFCVITEDFKVENIRDEDLVSIAPAGYVHLEMVSNIHYLSAISEDTWFDTREPAQAVADRIRDVNTQYNNSSTYHNAKAVITLLEKFSQREIHLSQISTASDKMNALMDLSSSKASLERFEKSIVLPAWVGVTDRFPIGKVFEGKYSGKANYGIFVELEPSVVGLAHVNSIAPGFLHRNNLIRGDLIHVKVISVDVFDRKIGLELFKITHRSKYVPVQVDYVACHKR